MSTSPVPYICMYVPVIDPFLFTDTLSTGSLRARRNLLANNGQCWLSSLYRNPQSNVRTFSLVNGFAPVAQNYSFCSLRSRRRGTAMSLPKGKKTKQLGGISSGAAERRGRHQRSNDIALCHLFWPFVFCLPERRVIILRIFIFILY